MNKEQVDILMQDIKDLKSRLDRLENRDHVDKSAEQNFGDGVHIGTGLVVGNTTGTIRDNDIVADGGLSVGVNADPTVGEILIGNADTNLYRAGANELKTDDKFVAVGDIYPEANPAGLGFRLRGYIDTSYLEHMNGSSRPTGWYVAGSPFATPASEVYANSLMQLVWSATVNERLFVYAAGTPVGHLFASFINYSFITLSSVGIRMDDGTDDNYIEFLYEYYAPMQFRLKLVSKVGGGGGSVITQTSSILLPYPTINFYIYLPGTRWSNWGTTPLYSAPFQLAHAFTDLAGFSGLSWTPTRFGVVANKGNTAADWMWAGCDWFKSN